MTTDNTPTKEEAEAALRPAQPSKCDTCEGMAKTCHYQGELCPKYLTSKIFSKSTATWEGDNGN